MKEKHHKINLRHKVQQVESSQQPKKFRDFFKFANFFHNTLGIQPYGELDVARGKSLLANLIFFVEIVNVNMVLLLEIVFVVKAFANGNNFVEAIIAMSYIGFVLVGNCKLLFVWWQKSALTEFVKGLKQLFPNNMDSQQSYDLQKYLRQCSRITLSFSLLYMMLIWTYNLLGIVEYIICDRLLGWSGFEQSLPYIMYIPWDWHQHWSFYVLYAAQDCAGYTSAAGQIASDLFLVSCITQLMMHFDYVSQKILNFRCATTQQDSMAAETKQQDLEFLKNITRYHAHLLDLSEQINHVFGVPLLLNFITSAFVICFVGFQITIGASPDIMFKLFLFLISSIAQLYLICHYGQQLLDVSTNVAAAVYNQNWFCADLRYQKMLILIATRAQKPNQLRATTFVHVSRATMSEIMQISYKCFAVLRTMYGNE